jgi:hypothetical protein
MKSRDILALTFTSIWSRENNCGGVIYETEIFYSSVIARSFLVGKSLHDNLCHEILIRKVKCQILGGTSEGKGVNLSIRDCTFPQV